MNATLDPTMDAIESLKDSSKWHVVKNVPIFKPHIRKDESGKAKFQVIHDQRLHDDAPVITLQEVMEACERRDAPGKLQIGHTLRDQYDKDGVLVKVAEEDQPDMVGVFQNYHLGYYGPKNQIGLLVDFYYMDEHFNRAKNFRARSVEFYPQTKEITTVALLKKDPELDMGFLFFERQKGPCYFYSSIPMDDSLANQVIPDEEEDKVDEEYSKQFQAAMKKHYPKFHEQYGCGSMPSATNVVLPTGRDGEPSKVKHDMSHYEKPPEVPVVANGKPPADPLVKENAEMYAKNAALEQRLAALEAERRADLLSVNYERQLRELDPQGQILKMDEELATLRTMNEEQAKRHLGTIERVTQYSRSPVGQPLVMVDGVPQARTGPVDQYEQQRIVDYVTAVNEERDKDKTSKRMTFAEGIAEFRKQGVK